MNLAELTYIVVTSAQLPRWRVFAERVMGAMVEDGADGSLRVRLDEQQYRLLVLPGTDEKYVAAGWLVRHAAAYQAAMAHARSQQVEVVEATPAECEQRGLTAFFRFDDPAGNVHEVCWGRRVSSIPFHSIVGVSGFVTGDLGLGHVVLPCSGDYDQALAFYPRVMGLECSDFFSRVMNESGKRVRGYFFHCNNARQHSLALVEVQQRTGLLHWLAEVETLDDVGRAMDRAGEHGFKLARTLGRHINDSMVSFYLVSPGGFQLEYGYGGERMDWSRHEVVEIGQGSHWGHVWQDGLRPGEGSSS